MFQATSTVLETITPDKAAALLKLNTFKAQRPFRPKWAEALEAKMKDGRFRTGEIATATNGDGQTVLINGQHQLTAIVAAGIPTKCKIERFECQTPGDMANLFRQFDCTGRRSLPDMAKAEADSLGLAWPTRIVGLVVSAADLNPNGQHSARQASEKVDQLKHFIPEGEFINNIFGGQTAATHRHMMRAPVAAQMIRTWRKSHADAETFWGRVAVGEMLKRTMPEYLLRDFLLSNGSLIGHKGTLPKNRLVTSHEFMARCATAWNAFRAGRELKVYKYFPAPVPVPRCI